MISVDKAITKTTLRIGIMCNGLNFSAWEAETIRNLINTKGVSLELLIGNSDRIDPIWDTNIVEYERSNIIKRIPRRLLNIYRQFSRFIKSPLWNRYERFVNKHCAADCDKQISMRDELIDVDMIYCRTYTKGKYSQYFEESDLNKIKSYDIDVILRFGFNIIRGEILKLPTYGVWSFHHGNYLKYRGGPPGFWEIYNEDPWSGAILQKLTDKLDDGIVLYKNQFITNLSSYSKNKNKLFLGTTKWPSIICRNILSVNDKNIFIKSKTSTAPIYTAPTNLQTIKYFYIIIKHRIKSIFKKTSNIKRELWAIGINKNPVYNLINSSKPIEIEWIEPPPNQFYADPFLVKKDDTSYIFFEDYSYQEEKGRISFIETKDFETFSDAKPAIDTPFHLSYPFILTYQGKYYCIPEQHSTGEVALYEAESFPDGWTKKAILLKNFHGIDPTIIRYDNLWWMFIANQKDNDSSKLHLFYSDNLVGHWKPHKHNPVKIFPKMTRPAGAIIEHNGKLIRPAQNCTVTYGGSIIFYEIVKLSTEDFKEVFIGELLPNLNSKYPDGLHHIIQNNNITIIDGKRLI
ncbi:hypothetical protein ACFL5D_02470 [Candidatus Neomarinimicrobiota bacterium]